MRRTMTTTAASAAFLLALTGCGESSGAADGSAEIPPAANDGIEIGVGDPVRVIEDGETLFTLTVDDISDGAPEECEGESHENDKFITLDTTVEAANDTSNGTIEGTEFTSAGPSGEEIMAGTTPAGVCNMEVGLVPSVSDGESAEGVIVLDIPDDAESVTYERFENEVTWAL